MPNNQPDPPVSQVLTVSTWRDTVYMKRARIYETLREYQKANKIEIAKDGGTIMENNIRCLQESNILPIGFHKDDILAFSPDGSLFAWDNISECVRWLTAVGKPLHVSYQSSENCSTYLSMVRGSLKLYKHSRNPKSVVTDLPHHPYEYNKDGSHGTLTSLRTTTVIHVYPDTGCSFEDHTRDFYTDGNLHFKRDDFELTCYDPESQALLWYLRFAFFKALQKNNYEPPRKGQNVLTEGTVRNIAWRGIGIDKYGNIVRLGEYELPFVVLIFKKRQIADDAIKKEVRIIKDVCTGNLNLLNVFGVVSDNYYHNVLIEHCNTSLSQFMDSSDKDHKILLKLIRGIVTGLIGLHAKGIFLGNLDISKIFVDIHSNVKISVISENTKFPLISSLSGATDDMLALGRLIFFILAGVKYQNQNLTNIVSGNLEASNLLWKLLNEGPASRQTALKVWNHPLLWDPSKKLEFISAVSEHLETEDGNSDLSKAIKNIGSIVFGGRWNTRLDVELCNAVQSGANNNYNHEYSLMYYLIRFIRNLKTHKTRIANEINQMQNVSPEVHEMFRTGELGSYFFKRFPKLVMKVYIIMKEKCGEEITFRDYFKAVLDD